MFEFCLVLKRSVRELCCIFESNICLYILLYKRFFATSSQVEVVQYLLRTLLFLVFTDPMTPALKVPRPRVNLLDGGVRTQSSPRGPLRHRTPPPAAPAFAHSTDAPTAADPTLEVRVLKIEVHRVGVRLRVVAPCVVRFLLPAHIAEIPEAAEQDEKFLL